MRKIIAAAVIASATATSACGRAHGEDNDAGPDTSRNYQVANFQQIEVAGPYDVEVRTGSNPSVSARGSQKLLEKTVVEVKGDKLVIHPEKQDGWFHTGWGFRGKAHFIVTVPALTAATIAGSGDIKVDKVQGNRFEGSVAGSGGLALASVNVQTIKLAIAGSGGVKAGAGKTASADYDIAGSGDIDAGGVQANDAKVSIAGSGSVRAHSSGTADVSIMGSGDVNIAGGAKCSIHKAGSGNVSCS